MAAEAVRGNDMKNSAKRELKAVKHRAADIIESVNPLKETKKMSYMTYKWTIFVLTLDIIIMKFASHPIT